MEARYLEEHEVNALRRSMPWREWLPFQISLETGMRIGDVLRIRWEEIDGREIRYQAQKTGKLGVARVSAPTARWLAQNRTRATSQWVFASPKKPGSPITRQAAWKRIKTAARRVGLSMEGVSPHSFRKCFAVDVYHRDGIKAVQEALQHARMDVTEIYALSDWMTGEEADKPLLRQDIVLIARAVAHMLRLDKLAL